ncbi:MAG TPA: hypothetical protein VEK07_01395 [Polyangiaceae bacterium]|nr:hypothetical protein [Polyangiaceae bacterium]
MSSVAPPPDESAVREADPSGGRSSASDLSGSVPRFDMTYSPPSLERAKTKFGPPIRSRIPSALYLAAALALGGVVLYAYAAAPSSSRVFAWVVEGDAGRPLSASILAAIVVLSAIGTVLRTHMRGVLVGEDWIEARYLLPLGIPRARRWGWPQVLRVVVDDERIALELWDGSFERLPEVARAGELVDLLIRQARRRRIDVTELDPTPL